MQVLRTRWPSLYAARKRRLDPKIGLPELPNTFFGWIPKLYKVTEEQILASAGLDAFVVRQHICSMWWIACQVLTLSDSS